MSEFVALLVVMAACSSSHHPEPRVAPAKTSPAGSAGTSVALPDWTPVSHESGGQPMSLTASDGTALRLVDVTARTLVEDPLAFTEVRLSFDNPEDRVIEGRFNITLPSGAAVSRFAMKIDGRWQEAEVVELQRARRTYEDFLHRKQDPALLEQAAGNEFSARVFPIAPHARKELVISYSQELAADAVLVPLRGLPQIDNVDVTLSTFGADQPTQALVRADYVPEADFGFDVRLRNDGAGLRSGTMVLARVNPVVSAQSEPLRSLTVLVDTSASRALGLGRQLELLRDVVATLVRHTGPAAPLSVACFDQTTQSIYEGAAGGFGTAHLDAIKTRGALGASNLVMALDWARGQGHERVVMIGDGVVTAGPATGPAFVSAVTRLGAAGVKRLDAIATGGIRDDDALRTLVTTGLPHAGVVIPGASSADIIDKRLTLATRSNVPVSVAGASFWHPRELTGVQAGDAVLIYADVPADAPVVITLGDAQLSPELKQVAEPLLSRSSAAAKVASLLDEEREKGTSAQLRKRIVDLSTKHRVLSPYTALLVLETDADFARFHIDRNALADVLTIQNGQLAAGTRAPPQKSPQPFATPGLVDSSDPTDPNGPLNDPLSAKGNMWGDAIGDSFGAGGLGLTGVGEGGGGRAEGIGLGNIGTIGHGAGEGDGAGFGSGHGRLGRSHIARVPRVRMGATNVSGRLPPEVIARIVRQNFGRFRACYQEALLTNPDLRGRVVVRFVIGRDGRVSSVSGGGDLPSEHVTVCVTRAFHGMTFPPPEGGLVTVSYPILFAPDGDASTPAPSNAAPSENAPRNPAPPPTPPPAPPKEQPAEASPYTGKFKEVMDAVDAGDGSNALKLASAWRRQSPGDVLALVALGKAFELNQQPRWAARSYGSIIDLYASRADLRRYAATRLEAIAGKHGAALALDSYRKAKEQRPDHPSSHRLLGFSELANNHHAAAFEAILAGLTQRYAPGRFAGVDKVLREDLGLIAAAWIRAEPAREKDILARLAKAGAELESEPSLRFVLNWETDANDVDFHIYNAGGDHAYYRNSSLPNDGGELYADVTSGYGPECFTIRKPRDERSASYTLQAHYYARGPMGYGMGKVQIIDHDGKGRLRIKDQPFVVMKDEAFVNLGVVHR